MYFVMFFMEKQISVRKTYESDISREQFEQIRLSLEGFKKRTKPRKVDLYEVFCALLYLLKSGCQWRMLPGDFPKWRTVYSYHEQWCKQSSDSQPSLLESILQESIGNIRISLGRKGQTSFCIVDAQSVKNVDTAENKGYDAGKNVSGIKRHIAVDTNGFPHALCVTTANITDRDGAIAMFTASKDNLSSVKNVLVDGGYSGEKFAQSVKELIGAKVEVAKRSELHKFAVIPKRWVVERSFAWLDKCRRLWKNCERKLNTSLQFMVIAFIRIILKRL